MKKTKPLKPFFKYYGSKWNLARYYHCPQYKLVIEPFAGSACYALHHWSKNVILNDLDENIYQLWHYLINVKASEIKSLPYLQPDQTVDDLKICKEAKILIGFWIGFACSAPKKTQSETVTKAQIKHPNQCLTWADPAKQRIIEQLPKIRHWKITNKNYYQMKNYKGTWFIDPPYEVKGKYYRKSKVDYERLSIWAQDRREQYIVCENNGAQWMNFTPFKTMHNQHRKNRDEVVCNFGFGTNTQQITICDILRSKR